MVHCVNHRIELALKEAMKAPYFQDVDTFYQVNFCFLRNSGALKESLKQSATVLDITYYVLPKITGTRFVSHRKRGFQRFLHLWPVFIMTYQNAVSAKKQNKVTLAKIAGLLSKFQNVEYLYRVCLYLDILEKVSPLSLVFEGENRLPCEIRPNLRLAIEGLAEIKDSRENEAIEPDSNMRFFYMVANEKEEGQFMLTREYQKAGHELRKEKNKGFRTVQIGGMKMNNAKSEVSQPDADVASKLIDLLEYRFKDFKDDIYQHMKWLDPQYWDADDRLYGNIQITASALTLRKCLQEKVLI